MIHISSFPSSREQLFSFLHLSALIINILKETLEVGRAGRYYAVYIEYTYSNCIYVYSTNFRLTVEIFIQARTHKYEGWNFNSGNYLFTTETK